VSQLLILAVSGFVAQLIDGALGMGYGVTSTTLLLTLGLAPATVSASVHAGEVVTTLVSGIAHWRFGNVDRAVVWRLALPGAIGAFAGAFVLSSLPVALARPLVSAFLLALGVTVLIRFARPPAPSRRRPPRYSPRFLTLLGLVAGFFDATGGGGWGPISTSTLLAGRESDARKVIGSVDASEFLVALSATAGFTLSLGWQGINATGALALVIGGIFAAPLAAWAVRMLPTQVLGIAVAAMILLSNGRTLLSSFGIEVPFFLMLAGPAAALAVALLQARWRRLARERAAAPMVQSSTHDAGSES